MVRVLTLMDVFSFNPMGGAGRVMFETARHMVRRGHEVTVVCRRRDDLTEDQVVDGVRFRTFASAGGGRLALLRAAQQGPVRTVASLLAEGRGFDAVHAHHPHPLLRVRGMRALRNVPIWYTFHSPWPEEVALLRGLPRWSPGVVMRAWMEAKAVSVSRRVHALSHSMFREARRRYGKFHGIVINGGVDLERFRPPADREAARAALGWRPGERWLLTVRRLVPRMGVRILVDAMARLAPRFGTLRLAVGGTGPLRGALERHAARCGVQDRIRFLGYVDEAALPALYGAADLFVVPSRALEGFGMATVEALACGTPAVGTPVGGTREVLIPLDSRCIATAADSHGLMRALEWWLSRTQALAAMRPLARAHAEARYGWDRIAAQMETAMTGMLARSPS
ncbi:MAG: glycosyltransferase family 4 protein [Planctomycetes bacterium]|nr:glycosyltransferase family 4 protein [Planctomycetota bacterium]